MKKMKVEMLEARNLHGTLRQKWDCYNNGGATSDRPQDQKPNWMASMPLHCVFVAVPQGPVTGAQRQWEWRRILCLLRLTSLNNLQWVVSIRQAFAAKVISSQMEGPTYNLIPFITRTEQACPYINMKKIVHTSSLSTNSSLYFEPSLQYPLT